MILREQLGISADGSEAVYRADDIDAFVKRSPDVLTWSDRDHRENIEHFFTAVDPSGGGPSAFAICSVICLSNGSIQVHLGKCWRGVEASPAQSLVRVQQAQRAAQTHEAVRTLPQVFHKWWRNQRKHTLGQIVHEQCVRLPELVSEFRLLPNGKQQHRSLARNTRIGRQVVRTYVLYLALRLAERDRTTMMALQHPHNLSKQPIERRSARIDRIRHSARKRTAEQNTLKKILLHLLSKLTTSFRTRRFLLATRSTHAKYAERKSSF